MKLVAENNNKTKSILNHLMCFGKINTWTSFTEYRVTRLSSIIFNLRERGYAIESVKQKGEGTTFVDYVIHKQKGEGYVR
jgi:hypothetical protein